MRYPLDNLFRRPVELASSVAALSAAAVLWSHPQLFLVTPATGTLITIGLLILAGARAHQAQRIIQFQRNLKRLPEYQLVADEIPWSKTEEFLGRGFYWSPKHTQRLYTAHLPENDRLRARNDWYQQVRAFERRYPDSFIARLTRLPAWWNPVEPLAPVGGDPTIHGIEPNEQDIWSDITERVGHKLVLGTTRVGKTRLAEILITQDIRRGDVTIVFDPKGDVDLLLRMYAEAKRCQREKAFYFFHLGYPDISARYSPIGTFSRITEVATRIAGQLPSEGQSAAFKEFVWRFINVMARAMTALGDKPTYEMVYQNAVNFDNLGIRYFECWLNRDHPGWEDKIKPLDKKEAEQAQKTNRNAKAIQILNLIRANDWTDPIGDGIASVLSNERSYFEKLVSSLYPLLEKLTTGKVSELLSPDTEDPHDPRAIFDWGQIIDCGGIVYIGLDALSDFEVAGAVGNAMFADLTSRAGLIYKNNQTHGQRSPQRRKISIHADEFNELVGDEFIPMVNKAGGAGYQVTAYTQTISDVEAKIGNKAKAEQIEGNFNTLIMLRVKNLPTAEVLTHQLPEVEVFTRSHVCLTSDETMPGEWSDFKTSSRDQITSSRVPLIAPSDLVRLPKGQAFALIEGGQLVKLRIPLARNDSDEMMMFDLSHVVADMRKRYESYVTFSDKEAGQGSVATLWKQINPIGHVPGVTVEGRGAGF